MKEEQKRNQAIEMLSRLRFEEQELDLILSQLKHLWRKQYPLESLEVVKKERTLPENCSILFLTKFALQKHGD